jgi:hypothetical protein
VRDMAGPARVLATPKIQTCFASGPCFFVGFGQFLSPDGIHGLCQEQCRSRKNSESGRPKKSQLVNCEAACLRLAGSQLALISNPHHDQRILHI